MYMKKKVVLITVFIVLDGNAVDWFFMFYDSSIHMKSFIFSTNPHGSKQKINVINTSSKQYKKPFYLHKINIIESGN